MATIAAAPAQSCATPFYMLYYMSRLPPRPPVTTVWLRGAIELIKTGDRNMMCAVQLEE